ncbi:uncharacterized protein DUF2332 [Haloactinospora alba]|uniref:Uncharacterized protein DUF2332 n=1 Tax=Haloactinospora alba TaxID=405555 RepID=A0A543NIE3_9ACTN|nr:DUF2332 domain-containing protein [Haloactinospora alba]TQN31607.1 uncharacterized protein DUF2332 [Haloactinospora alba]
MSKPDIAERYHRFACHEAHPTSPLYTQLALGVASDPAILALLNTLPAGQHHPTLLFASTRYLTGTPAGFPEFRETLFAQWHRIAAHMQRNHTQTNEPARCAPVYPVLGTLPQPLTLIELGSSSGLCLHPDRYAYEVNGTTLGAPDSPVRITCRSRGHLPQSTPPHVTRRIGIDLAPLDPRSPEDRDWLRSLVWPEHHERAARLESALRLAATEPVHVLHGDATSLLPEAVAAAPPGTTIVVTHTTTLTYLAPEERRVLAKQIQHHGLHWIAQENPDALPFPSGVTRPAQHGNSLLLAHNTRPLAWTDPHTGDMCWLS